MQLLQLLRGDIENEVRKIPALHMDHSLAWDDAPAGKGVHVVRRGGRHLDANESLPSL